MAGGSCPGGGNGVAQRRAERRGVAQRGGRTASSTGTARAGRDESRVGPCRAGLGWAVAQRQGGQGASQKE